jgi:L-ascorbate metabolism protein UlaG (beta-lactamase superfamily)
MQTLIDEPVLGLEQQLLHQHRLPGPRHPSAHEAHLPFSSTVHGRSLPPERASSEAGDATAAAGWQRARHGGGTPVTTAVGIGWLGHATVLIELDGVRLLTDPVLGRRVGVLRRVAPPIDASALTGIDAVLLSHLHADHADPRSLRRVGAHVPVLAAPGAASWLRRCGIADAREIGPDEATAIGSVVVSSVPADHEGRRWPRGGPVSPAIGFLLTGSSTVYFAGDTDLFDGMAELTGRVDIALLPVAGWGPKLGPGHLDAARAAEAAAIIQPRHAIPIHWGTLAMPGRGPRDPAEPARSFARLTAARAPQIDVRVLAPGEHTTLGGARSPASGDAVAAPPA